MQSNLTFVRRMADSLSPCAAGAMMMIYGYTSAGWLSIGLGVGLAIGQLVGSRWPLGRADYAS